MSDVLVTQAGPMLEVLFNRALTGAMYDAVVAAFRQADNDPAIRVVLLSGVGDTFTSGNETKDFQSRGHERVDAGIAIPDRALGPGDAPGGGGQWRCDRRWHDHAGARRSGDRGEIGMVRHAFHKPGAGSGGRELVTVPKAGRASESERAVAAGDPMDAETARDSGFVNQVVADADLMSTARGVAGRLAALPPAAVRQTKDLIKNGLADVPGRIEQELMLFRQRLRPPETRRRRFRRSWKSVSRISPGSDDLALFLLSSRSGSGARLA